LKTLGGSWRMKVMVRSGKGELARAGSGAGA
jgi:hypothetical protein